MCALILLAQRSQFTIENFVIDMIRVMLYDDIIFRNGTGTGGTQEDLEQKTCHYEQAVNEKLYFQHGETSKQLVIRVNPDCKVCDSVDKILSLFDIF